MSNKTASLVAAALLGLTSLPATATTTWSAQDYDIYPLQIDDVLYGKTGGILYVAKDPAMRSGTVRFVGGASSDVQSWNSDYLGIQWSGNQYTILTADFNGDGNTDILMQGKTSSDSSHLLLATGPGQFHGISQTIASTALSLGWTSDQHKLHAGDFNGDGRADLFFQATSAAGTHAIAYTDGNGQFTNAATQTWTNASWGSFKWATTEANIVVGNFGGPINTGTQKPMADLLIQAKPKIVLIDYEVPIPVHSYTPNSFGVVFSAGDATPFGLTYVNQWSRMAYGVDWSPLNYNIIAANFDNSDLDDLLFQARTAGRTSYLVTSNSLSSIFATGSALSSSVDWSAASNRLIAVNFSSFGSSAWGVYLQAQSPSGNNYFTTPITGTPTLQAHDVVALTGIYPTTAVGAFSGTAGVSSTGAATYTIPLDLPPGINGMTPRLAVVHRSDSGAGLLGMSWNLAGISSIARCDRTVAQNVSLAPETYSLQFSDRYCLDGNQLKLVSNIFTYGLDGSQYRTELETHALITAHGAIASSGPQSFTVRDKAGLDYEYGGTADSRLLAFGGEVRSWQVNRISDRAGNEIRFVYASDQTSGSMRPETITYTGRSGLTPAYTISFSYNSLAAPLMSVSTPGGTILPSHSISRITLKYNNAEMRSWRFAYAPAGNGLPNRPLLTAAQMCGVSDAECLAPVNFAWGSGGALGWGSVQGGFTGFPTDPKFVRTLDFNGDGFDDVAYFDAASTQWKILWASASGYTSVTNTGYGAFGSLHAHKAVVMDVDGNGKADLIIPGSDPAAGGAFSWMALKHTSGTSVTLAGTSTLFDTWPAWSTTAAAADVNGDGFPDILYHNSTEVRAHLHSSDGAPSFGAFTWKWNAPAGRTILSIRGGTLGTRRATMDFDANGRQDLFVQLDTGHGWLFANHAQMSPPTNPIYTAHPHVAGIFGHGKCVSALAKQHAIDTFLVPQTPLNCGRSIGYMSAPVSASLSANIVVADYNGDGAQDVIDYSPNWSSWVMSPPGQHDPNNGYGVQYPISLQFSGTSSSIFASDIDGDGLDDLTQIDTAGVLRYTRHAGTKAERLTSVTDGFGNIAAFTYRPTSAVAGSCTTNDYVAPATGLGLARHTRPFYVVCKLTQSNGIGGTFDLDYSYANPTTNVVGRGFAGFESRSVVDSRNGLYHLDEYSLSFPTTGMVTHSLAKQSSAGNAKKIREVTTTLATLTQGSDESATYFPYVSATSVDTYEVAPGAGAIDGTLITNQTTAVTTIDAFGNITDQTYTTTDRDSASPLLNQFARVRTQRTITNDTTNWCLGVPTQVQTTSTLFDGTNRTHTQAATVDYVNCRVTQHVNEPLVPALKVTTDLGYAGAACGNVSSVTVTGMNAAGTTALLPRQTSFDYGAACRFPEQITDALGNVTGRTYRYDLGLPATETDPNGLQGGFQYDSFGRVTLQTRPDQTSTAHAYSSCNQINGFCGVPGARLQVTSTERETTAAVIRTDYRFIDSVGRPRVVRRQLIDGALSTVETTYDALGRLATQSVPYTTAYNGKTVFGYDLIGRQMTAQLLDGAGTTIRSSSAAFTGRTTTHTNPRGKTTTRRFDVLGQLRQVTDPTVTAPSSSGSTTYGYTYLVGTPGTPGEVGGVLQYSITDALANVTKARTNLNGSTTQSIDPDRGTWTYEHDSLGELTKRTDAKGSILTFGAYDKLGRPVSRTEPEGTTDFTWGLVSNNTATEKYFGALRKLDFTLTGQGTPNYSETYKYDEKGRYKQTSIATATDGTYLVDYAYQATTGLLDTVTYPQSNGTTRLQVRYQYQNGIATSVRDAASGGTVFWQTNTGGLDAWGNLIDEQLGNSIRVKSGYDPTTGLLSSRKAGTDAPATNRQNLEYLWDANGNLTRRTDNRQLVGAASLYEAFTYDEIDRLSSTSSNAVGYTGLALTINAIGNITAKSDVPGTYTYPASGSSSIRPHAVTSIGSTTYGYDDNGSMTSRDGSAITWTSFGMPLQINGTGGLSSQFTYTPERQRWKQTATYPGTPSAVTETTLYIGGVMEKVTRSGSAVATYRHYIPAGSGTVVFVNFSDATTPQTYYVLNDHLGSTNLVTNGSATIVVNESFSAFGQRRDSDWVGPVNATDATSIQNSTRRGYTGHEHLDNLGFVHMNGRIQDPAIGRFISADPFIPRPGDSQSLNRYSYVVNGPLSATDPSGFEDDPRAPGGCTGFGLGCLVYELAPPSISSSAAIEGRANGAVAGLRPDVNYGLAVMPSDYGSLQIVSTAGGTDLWNAWGRGWLAFGNAVADYGRATAEQATEFAYASSRVLTGRRRPGDLRTAGFGYAMVAASVIPSGGFADDAARGGGMVFRGMRNAGGSPATGPTARTLGVRPGVDILVDGAGMVRPGTGGMSVSPSPASLPAHRRPPALGGTGNDPVWGIRIDDLGPNLRYVPDSATHGTIQPSRAMSIEEFQRALCSTASCWILQ